MEYFKNVNTMQELKKQYRDLVKKYHPDLNSNDTTAIMQKINSEYELLFSKVKNYFSNAKGEIYEKENTETPEEFREIINKIITFKNCKIEIIGNWIWVSGNTKYYKEILKKLNFKFIKNKTAWAYHKEKYYKKSTREYTLEELRKSFNTIDFETKELVALKK